MSTSIPRHPVRRAFVASLGLAVGLALTAPLAIAQGVPQRSGAITPTRLVKLFYGIERQLLDAQANGQSDVLKALLAEAFVQRSSTAPLVPVPREPWIAQAQAMSPASVALDQMAVHEHGLLAIVSFVMLNNTGGANRFVVDVWRGKGGEDDYELLTRYSGDIPQPPPAVRARKAPAAPAASASSRLPSGKN